MREVRASLTPIANQVQAVSDRLAPIALEVQSVHEHVTARLDKLARQVEKRDRTILANVETLLREKDPEGTAQTIAVDEDTLARVATLAAEKVAGEMETVMQEITRHDAQGRPLRFRRVLASGRSVEYQIERNNQGYMTGFSRKE